MLEYLSTVYVAVDTLQALRLSLAVTLAVSALSMLRVAPMLHERLKPNCWLIAVWSTVNAVLMAWLALVDPAPTWTLKVLNASSIFLLGSWSALMLRVSHGLRKAARAGRQPHA